MLYSLENRVSRALFGRSRDRDSRLGTINYRVTTIGRCLVLGLVGVVMVLEAFGVLHAPS